MELKDLKAGDNVTVHSQHGISITHIEKVTATQIVAGHHRFRRTDGSEIGGDRYWSKRISSTTPAHEVKFEESRLRGSLRIQLNKINAHTLNLDLVKELLAVFDKYKQVVEPQP